MHVLFVPVQPATSNAAAPTLASAPQNPPGGSVTAVGVRRVHAACRDTQVRHRHASVHCNGTAPNRDARAFSAPERAPNPPAWLSRLSATVLARQPGRHEGGRQGLTRPGSKSTGGRSGRGGGSGSGSGGGSSRGDPGRRG